MKFIFLPAVLFVLLLSACDPHGDIQRAKCIYDNCGNPTDNSDPPRYKHTSNRFPTECVTGHNTLAIDKYRVGATFYWGKGSRNSWHLSRSGKSFTYRRNGKSTAWGGYWYNGYRPNGVNSDVRKWASCFYDRDGIQYLLVEDDDGYTYIHRFKDNDNDYSRGFYTRPRQLHYSLFRVQTGRSISFVSTVIEKLCLGVGHRTVLPRGSENSCFEHIPNTFDYSY